MTPCATAARPFHTLALLLLFGAVAAHSSVSIRRGRSLGASLTRQPEAAKPTAGVSAHFLGRPSSSGKSGGHAGGHGASTASHHAHHAHGHDEEEESHNQTQSGIGAGFRRYWRELPILLVLMLLSGVAIGWGAWQLFKLHRQFQQAESTRRQKTENFQERGSSQIRGSASIRLERRKQSTPRASLRGSDESREGTSVRCSGGSRDAQDVWNFSSYLSYNISYWYVWSEGAPVKVIFLLFLVFYLAGTISYSFLLQKPALHSMYVNLCWLISPDAGSQENTRTGIVIGIAVSLGGLFIFALFLTSIHDMFAEFMANFAAGRSPVMESGHTVVLGFNSCTPVLLRELCEASGGEDLVIAVLAPDPKPDVEQRIRDAGLKLGSGGRCKIVVRSGSLHDLDKLKSVSVDLCKTVIIVRSEEVSSELRDAEAFRILRLLRGNKWPYDSESRICLACPDAQHIQIYQQLHAKTVMMSDFVAQLMVKCSEEHGLGTAIKSLVSFEAPGAELYIVPAPKHLEGRPFSEAQLYFPKAVPVGFANKTQDVHEVHCGPSENLRSQPYIRLCPDGERRISEDEDIILLAESRHGTMASKSPEPRQDSLAQPRTARLTKQDTRRQEIVVILGWNKRLATPMLEALNSSVSQDSEVIIFSKEESPAQEICLREEREKKREMCEPSDSGDLPSLTEVSDVGDWRANLGNLKVHFQQGDPSSPQALQTLVLGLKERVGLVKRVFIISDESIESGDADLVMINTTMHIRRIFERHGFPNDIRVIPEVRDPGTADMLLRGDEWTDIFDFVASEQLEAEILATFSCDIRIGSILDTISSADGVADFISVKIEDVTSTPINELSFLEASTLINSWGASTMILLGWELEDDNSSRLVMNPPEKNVREKWSKDNKLLLLAPRSGTGPKFRTRAFPGQVSIRPDAMRGLA